MATQEDRSLGSGITIPRWMKSKMNDKFDFDQSAFSPTELDDSFMFYYRQPPAKIVDSKESKMIGSSISNSISVTAIGNKNPDFSRHPTPCQKYLQNGDISPPPQTTPQMKIKSSGTDDGFKGEAAKCGTSIIRVASQMVSGKVVHGFTVEEKSRCQEETEPIGNYNLQKRRGSRSLPTSPLASPGSSPKTNRKAVNKYFTGAFTDYDKSKGSWILSNLLARRDLSQSVGYIGEETKEELEHASSLANIDELQPSNKSSVFKAKPSELREMNFWSPTSM